MNTKRKWITTTFEEIALRDGLDAALVGVVTRCGEKHPIAVYEHSALLKALAKEMSFDDAVEWIDVNINGAYIGPLTPFTMTMAPRTSRKQSKSSSAIADAHEIVRLRNALEKIAEMKEEPYCADFARDILDRREVP